MTPRPNRLMEWAVHNLVAGNTSAPWLLRVGIWGFYGICALQRRFRLVPEVDFREPARPAAVTVPTPATVEV